MNRTEMQCDVCGERWWDSGVIFCPNCGSEDINPIYEEEEPDAIHACGRCGAPSQGSHECPYQAALHKDHNPEYCTCCSACETRCRNDI